MLRISLLGNFQFERDGIAIAAQQWPRRKVKSLLKLLALRPGHQIHKEQAVDLLWPEMDSVTGQSNLYRTLYTLRRIIEPELSYPATSHYLKLKEEVLSLGPVEEIWVDVEAFEDLVGRGLAMPGQPALLEEAVRLYRGDLLEEDPYEEWIQSPREVYHHCFIKAQFCLAEQYRQHRNYEAAIQVLQRLVASDPLDEAAHRGLMLNYLLAGYRREALKQFQLCENVLKAEFRLSPAAETIHLNNQIVAGEIEPDLAVTSPALAENLEGQANKRKGTDPNSSIVRHLSLPKTNLPAALNTLIGREKDISLGKGLLSRAGVRLLTLTGPGGVGKTRLGLQIAAELLAEFEDGTFFIPLAALFDADLVVSSIAQALGVKEMAGQPLVQGLKTFLGNKHLLLVLDNFEQLLPAKPFLIELLQAASGLKMLITSRALLCLYGEHELAVTPLKFPEGSYNGLDCSLNEFPAITLFCERAQAASSNFIMDNDNTKIIIEICKKLDGLPLALELAAARTRLLTPSMLLNRLEDRFKLLDNGANNQPVRHQTLRGTIDWSYDLLSPLEKLIFRRLSIFAGGWSLAAAEAVCCGIYTESGYPQEIKPEKVLNLLHQLVNKSLVVVDVQAKPFPSNGLSGKANSSQVVESCYRMLETIREYASQKLREMHEEEAARQRHASWFEQMVAEVELKLRGESQAHWLDWLETENDNLRAVLSRQLEAGEVERAARIAGVLWWFWWRRSFMVEGRNWLEAIFAHEKAAEISPAVRAKGLHGLGGLVYFLGDYSRAKTIWEESLVLKRELADKRGISYALNNLGIVTLRQGDYVRAHRLLEEALGLKRELGVGWEIAHTLNELGTIKLRQGEYVAARDYLEESTLLFIQAGDKQGQAHNLHLMGKIATGEGDYQAAHRYHQQSLTLSKELGEQQGIADVFNCLGMLALIKEDYEQAKRLLMESQALFKKVGDRWGVSYCLNDLGLLALCEQDFLRAKTLLNDSLVLKRQLGDGESLSWTLAVLAELSGAQGNHQRMVYLAGLVTALRESLGAPMPMPHLDRFNLAVARAKAQLDLTTFAAIWAGGRSLTLNEGLEFALGETTRRNDN